MKKCIAILLMTLVSFSSFSGLWESGRNFINNIETTECKKDLQETNKDLKSIYLDSSGNSLANFSLPLLYKTIHSAIFPFPLIEKPTPPPNMPV